VSGRSSGHRNEAGTHQAAVFACGCNDPNRVRMYSLVLSGGSFTVHGPLRTKKSPSGVLSMLFHLTNTGSGLLWQLTTHTVLP
jgi:hypothetical protein